MFYKFNAKMNLRVYIDNLSNISHYNVFFTFRGSELSELNKELQEKMKLSDKVILDIYNKRFGFSNRILLKSLNDLPPEWDEVHVIVRAK